MVTPAMLPVATFSTVNDVFWVETLDALSRVSMKHRPSGLMPGASDSDRVSSTGVAEGAETERAELLTDTLGAPTETFQRPRPSKRCRYDGSSVTYVTSRKCGAALISNGSISSALAPRVMHPEPRMATERNAKMRVMAVNLVVSCMGVLLRFK